jgi:hypothetical protein
VLLQEGTQGFNGDHATALGAVLRVGQFSGPEKVIDGPDVHAEEPSSVLLAQRVRRNGGDDRPAPLLKRCRDPLESIGNAIEQLLHKDTFSFRMNMG